MVSLPIAKCHNVTRLAFTQHDAPQLDATLLDSLCLIISDCIGRAIEGAVGKHLPYRALIGSDGAEEWEC